MESGENVEKPQKKSLGKDCVAGGPENVSCTNPEQRAYQCLCFVVTMSLARNGFDSCEDIGQNGSQRKHQYCVPCILNCQTLSRDSI